jgi:hypothetical protein
MDLGATTPGHQPGELAITAADDSRWLAEMGALGVHAIRIYQHHHPRHRPHHLRRHPGRAGRHRRAGQHSAGQHSAGQRSAGRHCAGRHDPLENWLTVGYTERMKPGADALRQAFNAVSRS